MISRIRSIFAALFPAKHRPRVYIDAASFDPDTARPQTGRAVVIFAQDDEDIIAERVRAEKRSASGVVVLDQGSSDSTPHLAAEAGAVVVLQEPGKPKEEALQRALSIAKCFSPDVEIRC